MKGDTTLFTKEFGLASLERAIKTFAQVLIALFTAGQTVFDVQWDEALTVAGTAALVSVLTSLVSSQVGPQGSPSLVEYKFNEPEHTDPAV